MVDWSLETDLEWLDRALFVDGGFRRAKAGAHAALVRDAAVQRVVPVNGRAAAASFAKTHDAMTSTRQRVGAMSQIGLRAGAGNVVFRSRYELDATLDVQGDPSRSLVSKLAAEVSFDRFAATLGPHRANRKPVLQLIDNGHTVAYAKVACNELTADLVRNETRWLARAAAATGNAVLCVPTTLAAFDWQGWPVLVMSSAAVERHDSTRLTLQRVRSLAQAISEIGSSETLPVDEIIVRSFAPAEGESDLTSLATRVKQRFARDLVTVGVWHGDLTPWNTISEPERTWVLDWEFAAEGMPVGSDVLHHTVMVATHLHATSAVDALAVASQQAAATFGDMAPESEAQAAWALYLLGVVRRGQQLQANGADDGGLGDAAAAALGALTKDDRG